MPPIKDTAEQIEFREFARHWLEENRPPATKMQLPQAAYEVVSEDHRNYLCDWQAKCYEAGLIASDVDKRYGGHGHDGFQQIASTEIRRANVPYFINWIGLGMTVPTLLVHGTEEQMQTYFPKIFSAEEIWCQGFSEPGAGSDLASLQTSAIRDGDNWIINGRKVWTSLAHFASHILLLARTDKDNKHGGITYFVAPMDRDNGVTVTPIHKMTGESGFNEVTFDDLVIPDSMRIDEIGNGWKVAMSTLTSERGAGVGVGAVAGESPQERIGHLIALAKTTLRNGKPVWEDAVTRDRILKLLVRVEGSGQNMRRTRVKALSDHPMRIPLQGKLVGSEIGQELYEVALSVLGMQSSLYVGDPNSIEDGKWPLGYMNSYTGTISGGSSEVQRNILGERVLGLPKTK